MCETLNYWTMPKLFRGVLGSDWDIEKYPDSLFNHPEKWNFTLMNDKIYNWVDEKDKLIFNIPIPGLTKEDVEVIINDNKLIVNGLKQVAFTNKFNRKIDIPTIVDIKTVTANVANGILSIEFTKIPEIKVQIN